MGEAYAQVPAPLRRVASSVIGALHEPASGALGIDRAKRFLRTGDAPRRPVPRLHHPLTQRRAALALRASAPRLAQRRRGQDRLRNLYLRGGCRGGLNGGLYLDYKTFLPDDVLALSDRWPWRTRWRSAFRWWITSWSNACSACPSAKSALVREEAAPQAGPETRLNREQLRAPKRGFVGPTSAWLSRELRPMLEDELSTERLNRLGYFDAETVRRLMREHFERRNNNERILWGLLCFSTWHRLYVEKAAPHRYQPADAPPATGSAASAA